MELDEIEKVLTTLVVDVSLLKQDYENILTRVSSLITANNTDFIIKSRTIDKLNRRIDYVYEQLHLD